MEVLVDGKLTVSQQWALAAKAAAASWAASGGHCQHFGRGDPSPPVSASEDTSGVQRPVLLCL